MVNKPLVNPAERPGWRRSGGGLSTRPTATAALESTRRPRASRVLGRSTAMAEGQRGRQVDLRAWKQCFRGHRLRGRHGQQK